MTNLEKYRSLLHDGVQGLLLTSRYSRMYAAEFDIAEGVAVVSAQGARYFTDSRYIESAQKNLKGFEVVEIGLNNPMMQALKATLDEFGVETLGFEDEYLTVAELNGLRPRFPSSSFRCRRRSTPSAPARRTGSLPACARRRRSQIAPSPRSALASTPA